MTGALIAECATVGTVTLAVTTCGVLAFAAVVEHRRRVHDRRRREARRERDRSIR